MTDSTTTTELPPLAYSIDGLAKATSIGRTKIFEAIKKGRLKATRVGGRTLITVDDGRAWLTGSTSEDKLDHQPKPHDQRPPKRNRRP